MLGVGVLKQNLTWAGVDKEIRYSAAVTETRIQSGGTGSVSGGAGCYDLASAHERERKGAFKGLVSYCSRGLIPRRTEHCFAAALTFTL